jgi:hypothetical protein
MGPNPGPLDGRGLVKVRHVGTGLLMVTRRAVLRMIEAHPELAYENQLRGNRIEHALFNQLLRDRKFLGEDYSFSQRWVDLGGSIWLLADATIVHNGPVALTGNYFAAAQEP